VGGTRDGTRGGTRRLTQREAAELLGITVEAIKKRVKRGSLPSEMGEDGRRYVCVDASLPEDGDAATETKSQSPDTDLLYEEMRERIADLRVQLEAERTASAELRRIVAALTQRIPELEAPAVQAESPAPSDSREEAAQDGAEASGGGAAPNGSGAPGGSERVPRWRRVFG
jgi:hypothetical protein